MGQYGAHYPGGSHGREGSRDRHAGHMGIMPGGHPMGAPGMPPMPAGYGRGMEGVPSGVGAHG